MNLQSLCHTPESFERLTNQQRLIVSDLARSIDIQGVQTPYNSKQIIWKIMVENKIVIPLGLFENIDKTDSLEMWSSNFDGSQGLSFMFAMGDILRYSSYSLSELALVPWHELFSRPVECTQAIIDGLQQAILSKETRFDITPWHTVTETQSRERRSLRVRVKQITPFHSATGAYGGFALVEARPLFE